MKLNGKYYERVCEDGFISKGYTFDNGTDSDSKEGETDLSILRAMNLLVSVDGCSLSANHLLYEMKNGRRHLILDESENPLFETKQYKVKSFSIEFEPIG